MKEEKREIKTIEYQSVFIASDGTEFSSKEECNAYEESALAVIRTKASMLITFDTRGTKEDGWTILGGMDDNDIVAFKPVTQVDCDTLLQLILMENPYWKRDDMKEKLTERYSTITEACKNGDVVIFGINCEGEFYFINSRQNIINKLHGMDYKLDREVGDEK